MMQLVLQLHFTTYIYSGTTIADNKINFVMYSGDTIRIKDLSLVELEEYSGIATAGDTPHTFLDTELDTDKNIGLGASY